MSAALSVDRADAGNEALLKTADEAFDERVLAIRRPKCLRLQYGFLALRKAAWAKPMGGLAVCGRLLERVQKRPVPDGDHPVAVKISLTALRLRQALFGFEKFCIKRVLLLDKRVASLKCVELRFSVLHDLVLKFKDGVVDLDTLLGVRDGFDKLADCLDGCYGAIERGYDLIRCHGLNYNKNKTGEA